MRFFRRRLTPFLAALLTVVMQAGLFIAQAHVHPHPHGHPVLRVADVTIACRAIVRSAQCDTPVVPHEHRHDCPLCLSLSAANGVLPVAPDVVVDVHRFEALRPVSATSPVLDAASLPFQARAPPAA